MPHTAYRWRVLASAVRGTRHQKLGQPCQDAHHWRTGPEGSLVAAVADGAGSAVLGDVGAAIASDTAVTTLSALPWGRVPKHAAGLRVCLLTALSAARAAVAAAAATRQVPPHDLATTLIVLVATPALVAVGQIGDGAVVVSDGAGNVTALTTPQHGEYANETTFLTSPDALATAQVRIRHGAQVSLAAFSDGLQRLALQMPGGTPHVPFFAPLFRFLAAMSDGQAAQAQVEAFLRSARVRGRTDDDITLVLATLER
jgi:serine/threonine protein phosphatase PrpC